MLWAFPGNTKITTGFHEPRPVKNPGEHKHGAIDIETKINSLIVAPEKGKMFQFFSIRPHDSMYWNHKELVGIPYKNYFYDMFGGLIILKGASGFTHIFAHIYMNKMFNSDSYLEWKYKEEKLNARFPLFCFQSEEVEVFEGAEIGNTGNSGYSSGPHCHYEIHHGYKWERWENRVNPQEIIWNNFN